MVEGVLEYLEKVCRKCVYFRRNKTIGPFVGCSFCFVPQAWCRGWRRKVDRAEGDFEWVIGADRKVVQCQYIGDGDGIRG